MSTAVKKNGSILHRPVIVMFIEVHVLYRQRTIKAFFSSPVQSTGRAIVVTLAFALAFPSRHF